jgi:hypothetical protein
MSNTTKTQSLTSEQIHERILNSKGQFVRVMWKSNPTPAAVHKKAGIVLEKRTSAVCRAGINFANLSSVQQGIAEGTRGEVQELPWGKWKVDSEGNSLFPYSIEHNNVDYTRLYPTDVPCEVQYLVQNVQVTKEMYAEYLIPSEKTKLYSGEKPECFTIKTANILSTEDFEG